MVNKEKKTYVILGMHRSGTSFLAKALKQAGVFVGEDDALLGGNEWNIDGHFEDVHFTEFFDKIIIGANGSWDTPPSKDAINRIGTSDRFVTWIKKLINEHKREFWGWKDPRSAIVMTGDVVLPHLDGDVYLVCIFRKPKKVAESLRLRNNISTEKGIKLAKTYDSRIIDLIKKFVGLD